MKKVRMTGFAVLAALWLALVLGAWFAPTRDISEAERRKLAQMPEVTVDSILSGKFMEKFEDFTLDQFPLRDSFRTLKALVHYNVLQQGDNNEIYVVHRFAAKLEYPLNEVSLSGALEKFKAILRQQLERVEDMKAQGDFVDYAALDTLRIGVCGGDGIGPIISAEARRVLEFMLADLVESGKVEFVNIEGLTIENRVAHMQAIPDDVMEELYACDVILKGPTTTPRAGDPWPNIESANVAMRKKLDLFANVRPVKVPDKGIDWTFFRENTEGTPLSYMGI